MRSWTWPAAIGAQLFGWVLLALVAFYVGAVLVIVGMADAVLVLALSLFTIVPLVTAGAFAVRGGRRLGRHEPVGRTMAMASTGAGGLFAGWVGLTVADASQVGQIALLTVAALGVVTALTVAMAPAPIPAGRRAYDPTPWLAAAIGMTLLAALTSVAATWA